MKEFKSLNGHILLLEKGELVTATLNEWITKQNLPGGFVYGIGALEDVVIGFFNLKKKRYDRKSFPKPAELLSFVGNFSWASGKPVVHAHIVLGDHKFRTYGGHLFEARVTATLELLVTPVSVRLERELDYDIGLNLIKGPKPLVQELKAKSSDPKK